MDIWSDIKSGKKHVLWCNGLKRQDSRGKRSSPNDSDSDDAEIQKSTKKRKTDDKEERVGRVLDQLKKKHGENYTQFQLRIWSEMFVNGIYASLDDPPCLSERVELVRVRRRVIAFLVL